MGVDTRPSYQRIFDHPEAIARITGMARLVLHTACRSNLHDAQRGPGQCAASIIRNRADAIARAALTQD